MPTVAKVDLLYNIEVMLKNIFFPLITRPVLDWFQDSSKTGSGVNFFAAFLAVFCAAVSPLF